MGNTEHSKTIRQALPWLKRMMDYTDQVCAAVTEENGAHKPVDPNGGYYFSVKEQLLHIVDSRWECLDWMAGGEEHEQFLKERYVQEFGDPNKPWRFREISVKQAQQRLIAVRQRLDDWLNQPASAMLDTTESLKAVHQHFLEIQQAAGEDMAEFEADGPSCIADVLVFLAGHEQGHRSAIQMILRQHGQDVYRVT